MAQGDYRGALRAAARLDQLTPDWSTDDWQRDAARLAEALLAFAAGAFDRAAKLANPRPTAAFRPAFARLRARLATLTAELDADADEAVQKGAGDGMRDLGHASTIVPQMRTYERHRRASIRRALAAEGLGPPLHTPDAPAFAPIAHPVRFASPTAEAVVLAARLPIHVHTK